MADHFNGLSPAHQELLNKLIEESSEIIQAISKANLHGLESHEPGRSYPTNREHIENEIGDLFYFIDLAHNYGIISIDKIHAAALRKAERPNQYLHHVEP